jgi:hypothetical protein
MTIVTRTLTALTTEMNLLRGSTTYETVLADFMQALGLVGTATIAEQDEALAECCRRRGLITRM